MEKLRGKLLEYIKKLEERKKIYEVKENETIGEQNFWWAGMVESVRSTINDLKKMIK